MTGTVTSSVSLFAAYLRSSEFSSTTAGELANKLDELILASNANNGTYLTVGAQAETIAIELPGNEKQKANVWIQNMGGSTLIP